MKKFLFAVAVMMVTMLAAACGDTETVYEDPIPYEQVGPVVNVNYDLPTCLDNDDCDETELCMLLPDVTEEVGYSVYGCKGGCDAEFLPVKNEDGTSYNPKKPGTDTCQRYGNMELFCDKGGSNECKEYTVDEPVVDLTEPEPPVVEPETNMAELMCCYDGHLTGLYGAFAWSMSTPTDPEKGTGMRDLSLDASGCFNTLVDMDTVFLGFWVDMTYGPSKDKADEDIEWVATALKPAECYIEGEVAQIGGFNNGWKFGLAARK